MTKAIEKQNRIAERQHRQALVYKLGDLEEKHCEPCTLKQGTHKTQDGICKSCPIYTQIRAIGNELVPKGKRGRPSKPDEEEPNSNRIDQLLTVEQYHGHVANGLLDKEIAILLDVCTHTLTRWKARHKTKRELKPRGAKKGTRLKLDEVTYLSMRGEGLTNGQVAKRQGCNVKTLMSWQAENDVAYVMARPKKVYITKDAYESFKNRGISDKEIASEIGVVLATLQNWKKVNGIQTYSKYNKKSEEKQLAKKQQIRFIDCLDSVSEKSEVGEFVWR